MKILQNDIRNVKIMIVLVIINTLFNIAMFIIRSDDSINNDNTIIKNKSVIDSLKNEITKRDSLIHNIHENLKDTLVGVDNAPVSASHSAILQYLDTRR